MAFRFEIWDNYQANGGLLQASLTGSVIDGEMSRSVDNVDSLAVNFSRSTEWLQYAKARKILRVCDHMDCLSEWRISDVTQSRGPRERIVTIKADPPIADLGANCIMADVSTGGQIWHNLGGVAQPTSEYLSAFAIPALHRKGSTYIEIGTVESMGTYDLAWDQWNPGQLLNELGVLSETEPEYIASTSGHTIGLRSARGSSAAEVLLHIGRNLDMLTHHRRIEFLKTVIQPSGMVVPGGVESAGIEQNALLVTAVTGGTSGGTVTVEFPSSGDPPVWFNDQLLNHWALKPNGVLAQITSASTAQVLRLDNTSGVSTGEHLEIRATSDGHYLKELTNPAQLAAYGGTSGGGRIVATLSLTQLRGERNLVRNGSLFDWAARPTVYAVQADSSQSGNTLNLKHLPPSYAIKTGDLVQPSEAITQGNVLDGVRVTADATATTAGTATITVASTRFSLNGDVHINLWSQGASRAPIGYAYDTNSDNSPSILVGRRQLSITGDLSGVLDGAHDLNATTSPRRFNIRGLTASAEIQTGDLIQFTTLSGGHRVLSSTTASSSGAVAISYFPGDSTTTTLADGIGLSITRPLIEDDAFENVAVLCLKIGRSTAPPFLQSPAYTVRYDDTLPTLWASVGLTYHARSSELGNVAGISSWSSTGTFKPPYIVLWNVGTSSAIQTVEAASRTFSAGLVAHEKLQIQATLSSDSRIAIRLVPGLLHTSDGGVVVEPDPFIYARYFQLHLGGDPDAPAVEGSHANPLWQAGNRKLATVSEDPDVFELEARDLSSLLGYNSTDEELVLGGTARLYDEDLGIDSQLRIMSILQDVVDETNVRLTVAKRPALLSDDVTNQRPQTKVAVQVNITGSTSTAAAEIVTGVGDVILSSPNQLPPNQSGARRLLAGSTEISFL